MNDPKTPDLQLLIKLGSIVVHADEYTSPHGHEIDRAAIRSGLDDLDVQEWIKAMGVFLPVKRNK